MGAGIPLPEQPAAPVLVQPLQRATTIGLFSDNFRTGYVQQYTLTIQRELLRNTVIDAGYVGNTGIKLLMDRNMNQMRVYGDFLTSFRELQTFRSNGTPVSPGNTLVRIFGSTASAISSIGASVIDLGTLAAAADTVDRTYYTRYAAAGVSPFYLRRQAGALRFNANYTFSKSMDNISVDGNGFTTPIDNWNVRLNRARGNADRPHAFNSSFIYTLPVGRGQWLLRDAPRWADTAFGGWELGLLTIWQSGEVFTMSSGRATAAQNANTWANYSGDRNIGSVMRQGDGVFYLTPDQIAQFSFPAAGESGTSGRNSFRGPRFFGMDASLVKRFRITERHSVAFRAEAYNLFNSANFDNPGTNLVTPASFGKISATVGNARIMQMALRYEF